MKKFNLSDKSRIYSLGDWNIPVEDIKKFIKILKKEWKKKVERMEIMSGEVAIYELNQILDKIVGEKLV